MKVDTIQLNKSISPHLHSIENFVLKQDNLDPKNKKCSITLKKAFNRLNLIIKIDCKKEIIITILSFPFLPSPFIPCLSSREKILRLEIPQYENKWS